MIADLTSIIKVVVSGEKAQLPLFNRTCSEDVVIVAAVCDMTTFVVIRVASSRAASLFFAVPSGIATAFLIEGTQSRI